jgi:hypothetical protein
MKSKTQQNEWEWNEAAELMEWKHIAREAITAGPQTQHSNQTHGVE